MKDVLLWVIVWLGFSFAAYAIVFAAASFIAWDLGAMSATAHRGTLAVCLIGFAWVCISAAIDERDEADK